MSHAISTPPPTPTSQNTAVGTSSEEVVAAAALKTSLSEARALLNAVSLPSSNGGVINGVMSVKLAFAGTAVPLLEGMALVQAKASPELVALQDAVNAKDDAAALAWGARRGVPGVDRMAGAGDVGLDETGRRGWGDAFASFPIDEMWKHEGSGTGGGSGRAEWNAWHGSISGLVEGMNGVLAGLVDAAPSLRSALEGYLEMRYAT